MKVMPSTKHNTDFTKFQVAMIYFSLYLKNSINYLYIKNEALMKNTIIGNSLPNIPWEEKPDKCHDIVWKFSTNPITDRNPIPKAARIFNSAIVPFNEKFAGVFRADLKNGRSTLFLGKSKDGINLEFDADPIQWVDEFD